MKPSKPPVRGISADTFFILRDGVTYYPHAGEEVWFRSSGSIGNTALLMRFQNLLARQKDLGIEALPEERLAAIASVVDDMDTILMMLGASIIKWTWTDEEGNPYASPPTHEVMQSLSVEEVVWLMSAASGYVGRSESETKNGLSPSTSRSRVSKAAASRRSG